MTDTGINFGIVLLIGGIFCLVGFLFLLSGSKWVKPWGKQYVTTNRSFVVIGWLLLLLGAGFIVYQAGIRQ